MPAERMRSELRIQQFTPIWAEIEPTIAPEGTFPPS
jgi:hypothetical protein